ncbi:DNA-3-methyladenine glycosylase [Microcella alkalica]|uniref:Putative 3-methyladenine DNA glycosylase n=1 Tax=Microcella alkalica TaxID=355930 RepID=A0A839E5L6_9MICO|nr:DNA-3-methyladenine glycosylase [Microcella alkalica]MBA8847671.1 DNA-3-methyladenine glycosylase [Microcella alkalica]
MSDSGSADGRAPDPVAAALLAGDPLEVAPRLLGSLLHGRGVTVRLTEVEAYRGGDDPGSHAFRGETPRTRPMFLGAGHVYAYVTYGMHTCVNLVAGRPGVASGLLIRAGEVVDGADLALARRSAGREGRAIPNRDLARGPARLASALGVSLADSGSPLLPLDRADLDGLRLEVRPALPAERIATGPRVGVAGPGGDAHAHPWRFWIDGDPTVSVYRPAVARRRRPPA